MKVTKRMTKILVKNTLELLMNGIFSSSKCSFRRLTTVNTIFALSSSPGRSAVAVIRVSGPRASEVLFRMANLATPPQPRKVVLRKIVDPETKEPLDKALVLWFPAPSSFTGEDICELHVHGGPAVVSSVLNSLAKIPLCFPAQPGEFTKRAFINGKLDLTEVEGLADLLQAETEAQRKQALCLMQGTLKDLYNNWRERFKKCLANVEAYIDFSEEDNIEANVLDVVSAEVHQLKEDIRNHLADNRCGERLRSGVHVAIIGIPNVGKSSLLNVICQRDAAIVSEIPGTTRDVIELSMNIGGYPVIFSDTAGLRNTRDTIEEEGVRRAKQRATQADLLIVMMEAASFLNEECRSQSEIVNSYIKEIELENICEISVKDNYNLSSDDISESCPAILFVINKIDLLNRVQLDKIKILQSSLRNVKFCALSCKNKDGLNEFLNCLQDKVEHLCGKSAGEIPILARERYRKHLTVCLEILEDYCKGRDTDLVIVAHKLRKAVKQIGHITGHITTEEILSVIFKDFCIGK